MFITKFRPVAILALLSTVLMVSSQEMVQGLERSADKLMRKEDGNFQRQNYQRNYKFYNQCSRHHLQIIGHSVTAQGDKDSPFADIRLENVHYNHHVGINIMGERSGRYLCFNKKGKLIARFTGRNPKCIFLEEFSADAMYTKLRSLYNPDWFVGFNRRGKPLNGGGHATTHRERCFFFIKRDHSYLDFHQPKYPGPKMPTADKLQDYLLQQRLRRRHVRTLPSR